MKRLILPLFLTQLILADCSQNKKQEAQELWRQSHTMHGLQKSQALSKALQICSLNKIKVDFYLDAIEKQLNQGGLTIEVLNGLNIELSNVRSLNNELFDKIKNKNNVQIETLENKIALIEKKVETNQEKLNKLRAYEENSGKGKGFGTGERLLLPVLFANGSSRVVNNRKTRDLLKRIEATLQEDKNAEFSITGYASSRGGAKGNKRLSERRAYNTKIYLEKYISKGHLYSRGKGESDLICNSGYPVDKGNKEYQCKGGTENEASSRRIEILRRR